jgi:hypothetical protein
MFTFKQQSLLACFLVLAGCSDTDAQVSNIGSDISAAPNAIASESRQLIGTVEKVLLEQISCRQPPQAGVAMSAMLRSHTIANTDEGGDGIRLFIPVKQMTFLGHDIVRLGGWQADPSGGAMTPFGRGPGTAPPNHISLTVRGTVEQMRAVFSGLGISEAQYVPDHTQEAWVDSRGKIIQPRRLVPGPQIEAGDNDLAMHPLDGTVTITCSAEEIDFQRDIEARLGSK